MAKEAAQPVNTREPKVVDQTAEEFETEFGMDSNPEPGQGGTDPGEEAIFRATDELIAMDEDGDNIARLDRLEAERVAAAEKPEDPEGEDAEEEREGEDGDRPEDEAEEADEGEDEADPEEADEEDEADDPDEEGEGASPLSGVLGKLTPEKAQTLADRLFEAHGDKVRIPFKSNGQERMATIAELRQLAAGYEGQEAASRQIQQERQEVEGYKEEVLEILQGVQQQRNTLIEYLTKKPEALVKEVLLRHSNPDFMVGLRDILDKEIERIESDPMGFESSRRVGKIEETLGQLMQLVQGRETPRGPAPTERQQPDQPAGVPEDYGFIPGQGYPQQYSELAGRSLQRAARVAGIPFDEVLDVWEEGGKQTDPFEVLEQLTRSRFAEAPKVERAMKRKGKRRPAGKRGGVTVPPPNPAARKQARWDSIEEELADEVRQLTG